MNILLIYPEFADTFWSFKYALKFVRKKASSPPLGLVTIAAMLPETWHKRLVDLNITKINQKDLQWADYVFISAMVAQRDSARDVINRCKDAGVKIVAGGPLFTSESESFGDVDHLVLNEAEITLNSFLRDLEQGQPKAIYKTTEYADLRQTPIPMWELVDMSKYESMSIQFTRGCPFNCEFCSITASLGRKVRTKTTTQIIAELDNLYQLGWHRNIFFVDDNFIGKIGIVKNEILPALIEWRKDKKGVNFITEASINLADDEELMQMMVQAGFNSIFIGIETPDEDCLSEAKKNQNKNRNLLESVKKIHKMGLQVMGGFIIGFDNDSTSIFQKQIEFIQKSGIMTAMVGLLQAPYGTALYHRMEIEGRIINNMSGDNVDGSTNIIPKMDLRILKNGYHEILDKIYSPKYYYDRVRTFLKDFEPSNYKKIINFDEIYALFRSIFELGIFGPERRYYWRLFFWSLFHCPKKFPLAITLTIYGHHFRMVKDLHVTT